MMKKKQNFNDHEDHLGLTNIKNFVHNEVSIDKLYSPSTQQHVLM